MISYWNWKGRSVMGIYLNPEPDKFIEAINSPIYMDMITFAGKDDVLTLLIHLGYLGYDFREQSVFIPNSEIRREFVKAASALRWCELR